MKAGVSEELSRHGIDVPETLEQLFVNVQDPFKGLETTYLQEKFYREKFNCLVSLQA